jgi:hypothetical protein
LVRVYIYIIYCTPVPPILPLPPPFSLFATKQMNRRPKPERIINELEHLFATILGLMICCEPAKGVDLVRRDVRENEDFFREIFEVVRACLACLLACLHCVSLCHVYICVWLWGR